MIVMKFGGTSVGNAERIRQVAEIVRKRLSEKPVVVVSAHKGVTDSLIKLAEEAVQGHNGIKQVRDLHYQIIDELNLERSSIEELLTELNTLLKGISMVKELTPRTLDYVCSFGERFSARTVAGHFNKIGIPSEARDAFDIGLITDSNFGSASPMPEADALIKQNISRMSATGGSASLGKTVPVITGYIGKTAGGDITTLGRNGSDYTASIVGAAIDAKEIQIWTDVDGIMTADPSIIPYARPLDVMSFEEASELAYYGAEVLHPSTIVPAVRKGIPVLVLNTFRPEAKGTKILPTAPKDFRGIKSIAYKEGQFTIHITSTRMLMGHGFLARIFDIFARHRIVVNMVATSEVTVSVTTDSPQDLDSAARDLREFSDVRTEQDKAILCVVGEGLRDTPGIAGDVFTALKQANVNVLMISMGASKINLAFVIDTKDIRKAVEALHRTFFDFAPLENVDEFKISKKG